MSISRSRSSVKTFYVCNNCSRANAIAFNVVLFIEFICFIFSIVNICLFVCYFRIDGLHFTVLHLEGI
jgi:hypothetical protein